MLLLVDKVRVFRERVVVVEWVFDLGLGGVDVVVVGAAETRTVWRVGSQTWATRVVIRVVEGFFRYSEESNFAWVAKWDMASAMTPRRRL